MNDKRTRRMLEEIAKKYNLTAEPPDISNPSVMMKINAEVLDRCMPELEAYDAAEQASRAYAWKIWIV